MIHQFRGV